MIHVVYGLDDKYLPCLLVSMYSLLKTVTGQVTITIFVADPEFEDESSIHNLSCLFPNARIEIRRFDADFFTEYNCNEISKRWPPAVLIPLFIPWMIEEKCIFLDADTLILHDISELYNTNLNGCLIGACCEFGQANRYYKYFSSIPKTLSLSKQTSRKDVFLQEMKRLEFSIEDMITKYFNSGVVLMDVSMIRRADPNQDLMNIELARKHWDALPDQNRLNEFFKGKTHYLELKWNVYKDYNILDLCWLPSELRSEIIQATRNPGLLHFTNVFRRKSWNRPWYDFRRRFRIFRKMCIEIESTTGIPIFDLFDIRLNASNNLNK